jgi:transposase
MPTALTNYDLRGVGNRRNELVSQRLGIIKDQPASRAAIRACCQRQYLLGPITALCFPATIDNPTRFGRSRNVGAYLGLTTRRYASGEIDWTGRISKCGDAMLRSYLYEAANVLLTRIAKWSALKAWGMRLAKRTSLRKAKLAVARKLVVILHRMWADGTTFNWSSQELRQRRLEPGWVPADSGS